MLDSVYIGQGVAELDFGQEPQKITGVTLKAGQEVYTAGNDTGRIIEKDCLFATQGMADYVLAALQKVTYIPYTGTDALLDPAAEIGDFVTVSGVYSVLAQTSITFDKMCTADISAPTSDDLDEEYPYESAERRKIERLEDKIDDIASELRDISEKIENLPGTGAPGDTGYVISFNGRDGVVIPQEGDYTDEIIRHIREAIYESWKAEY